LAKEVPTHKVIKLPNKAATGKKGKRKAHFLSISAHHSGVPRLDGFARPQAEMGFYQKELDDAFKQWLCPLCQSNSPHLWSTTHVFTGRWRDLGVDFDGAFV
jgi:hypothetical protein